MNLKFIVTGTGRCGTVFMAKLLTSIGIPCGHESIFNYSELSTILEKLKTPELRSNSFCSTHDISKTPAPVTASWVKIQDIIAESSYLVVPFLFHPEIKDIPIIQVVRHPLEVISSFVKDFKYFQYNYPNSKNPYNNKGWEHKIYKFLPELEFIDEPIERASWFYVKWNNEIEKAASTRRSIFVQIENINYKELFGFLKIKSVDGELFSNTKENSNKKRTENFKITDISNETIKMLLEEKMTQYGYQNDV